jgi:6-phospho-beta-glucosidase
MKITILGAAGARTPLLFKAITERRESLGVTELALMDIDASHLSVMQSLIRSRHPKENLGFKLQWTDDVETALQKSDYVITTFRVGGMESRIIDEKVPLKLGLLGQETTGAGGFAMALRTIPVLLGYIEIMRRACPNAWILNFANPSGLLMQAIKDLTGWERAVGICDAPESMRQVASRLLGTTPDHIRLDYFGLNHLGWVRGVYLHDENLLPFFISGLEENLFDLPFSTHLIKTLGMIPNEYLFYYYSAKKAVTNLLKAGKTRGEEVAKENQSLYADLLGFQQNGETDKMVPRYQNYLLSRRKTYMATETGMNLAAANKTQESSEQDDGYGHVALNIMAALQSRQAKNLVLNTMNHNSIPGMEPDDIVEIPVNVSKNKLEPVYVGKTPDHALGLMKQVKGFEKLTIEAFSEKSYAKALTALSLHPLIQDEALAKKILDEYISLHGFSYLR